MSSKTLQSKKRSGPASVASKKKAANPKVESTIQNWIELGRLRLEKCELYDAELAYIFALKLAKKHHDVKRSMEALSGLMRLAGEAINDVAYSKWEAELEQLIQDHPKDIPAFAYYCKGVIARYRNQPREAIALFHKYLREIDTSDEVARDEQEAKGWISIGMTYCSERTELKRAQLLAQALIKKYEKKNIRGINGLLYLMMGIVQMKKRNFEEAHRFYQKAHGAFLQEHNWFFHLYVLFGYARNHRLQQNYREAYWYLDLVEKATLLPQFGILRREVASEKAKLEQDAVDLLIDGREAIVRTRDSGEVSLRKQYVLLHILEALSHAHRRAGDDMERGLSKAEIIQHVWNENYRPEAHDNKLYYNINRLRKLIEPDIKKPQYLLNWKEGYRLAPGLKVQFIGGHKSLINANLNAALDEKDPELKSRDEG